MGLAPGAKFERKAHIAICANPECNNSFTSRANSGMDVYCPKCMRERRKQHHVNYMRELRAGNREGRNGKAPKPCHECQFVKDCKALIMQVWFTPYCMPLDIDNEPNKLYRFWEAK